MSLEHERYIINRSDKGHAWIVDKKTGNTRHINVSKEVTDEQVLEAAIKMEPLIEEMFKLVFSEDWKDEDTEE